MQKLKQLIKKKEYIKAKKYIENISFPNESSYYRYMGDINLGLRYLNDAQVAYDKAISLNPSNIDATIGLVDVLIEKREFKMAESIVRKIVNKYPDNVEVVILEYRFEKEKGTKGDKIIQIIEKMPSSEMTDEIFYDYISNVYFIDDYKKCENLCKKFLRKFSGSKNEQQVRQLVYKIKKNRVRQTAQGVGNSLEKKSDKSGYQEEDPMSMLDELVGLDGVKKQIRQLIKELEFEKQRKIKYGIGNSQSKGYHFVFSGNPGTGKTVVARIVGKILAKVGIRETDTFVEVDRSQLVGEYIGQTAPKTKQKIEEADGGVLFIDEAYELYRDGICGNDFGKEAIDVLNKEMEDKRNRFSVILAGYKNEMQVLMESNPGLKSKVNMFIDFDDYEDKELIKIAKKMARERSFEISDDGIDAFIERIDKERVDEMFGNARTVRNIIEEAIRKKAELYAGKDFTKKEATTLTEVEFGKELLKTKEQRFEEIQRELNELIGLNNVKKQIDDMVMYNRYQILRKKENEEDSKSKEIVLHMAFTGNPGTGKTTVARLVGQMYTALGIIKKGHFVEVTRADLIAEYSGQTAIKTDKVIKRALGGILFIDEAYSLYQGENDNFGKEAIAMLIKRMDDWKESLVVILAGYPQDIQNLFCSNAGFKDRVKTEIKFEDYKPQELTKIFEGMCKREKYRLLDECSEILFKKFANSYDRRDRKFGNGRYARNYFEEVKVCQAKRIMKNNLRGDDIYIITKEDLL